MPPADSRIASVTGPRFLDPIIEGELKDATTKRYRNSLRQFMDFLIFHNFTFSNSDELDDFLVEWRRSRNVSKANFEAAVAACEHILPQYKHNLPWFRALLSAWGVSYVARRTVPLSREPGIFVACHMSAAGHAKLGAGLIIQTSLGLRPSELIGLQCDDVMLPEDRGSGSTHQHVVVGLGVRAGTKAKRAQTVLAHDATAITLLRWLRSFSS